MPSAPATGAATSPSFFRLLLAACLIAGGAHAADRRVLSAGHLMGEWAYADQPYCVVLPPADGRQRRWLCAVTVNNALREGGAGEHVVSLFSDDQGASWSSPLPLEPSLALDAEDPRCSNSTRLHSGADMTPNSTAPCYVQFDNAYSNILLTPSGRVYVVYNMNLKNISTLHGKHISRVDELGSFVMKYSDDVSIFDSTRSCRTFACGCAVGLATVCCLSLRPRPSHL